MSVQNTTQAQWTGMAAVGVCLLVGVSLVRKTLIHFRDTTIIHEPRPKTQYITQKTEDGLSPSTLEKLINSTTYGIRDIASRIVCDRALHDEGTIDSLLWHITRPDHDEREKGLRAIFMLATKSSVSQLNKPRVYSAIVKSLSFCVTDYTHDTYDKEFDSWDFRDVNERLCLMIVHRLTIEFGISEFVRYGLVSRWVAKEPWGETEEERQANLFHCLHQPNLLSYIILQLSADPLGEKEMKKASCYFYLSNMESSPEALNTSTVQGFMSSFDVIPSTEGGAPRLQERSPEEQRLRRLHRDAMVLHDNSQPLGIDSIITRDGVSSEDEIDGISRDELTLEADRLSRVQERITALGPQRREIIRNILRNESMRAEQAGLEADPTADTFLREALENEFDPPNR